MASLLPGSEAQGARPSGIPPLWEGAQTLHSSLTGTPLRDLAGESSVTENIAEGQEPVNPIAPICNMTPSASF